ncbi:MAG: NTP transferase domain-containing protein [Halobacteriovoraceae bacterium]|nr:NTP transferase domain-containing protein [Halobacteriovoraceae bacterium]
MQIDHCLILSAGFGVRMGRIGKILPKILWPVFEKTLLELQIKYARGLGCKNIYVNSHFLHEKISQDLKILSEKNVELIHEPILLGSGGSIHNVANLAKVGKKGILLVMNGDQFFFPDTTLIHQAMEKIKRHTAVLFSVDVEGEYGEVIIKNNLLVKINKSPSKKKYPTYSGMGFVNLEKLKITEGFSHFFTSVADFKHEEIPMLSKGGEYWDFGTFGRYYHSMFDLLDRLIQKKRGLFIDFLINSQGIFLEKINDNIKSYNHDTANVINHSCSFAENPKGHRAIIITSKNKLNINKPGIYYEDLLEEI